MGFDCKLISISGPAGWPTNVALARVLKNADGSDGPRLELALVNLSPGGDRTFSDFDDEEFIPFINEPPSNPPWQLKFALNGLGDARDLGETIISSNDTAQSATRFHPAGIQGPFYELTYRVLPD